MTELSKSDQSVSPIRPVRPWIVTDDDGRITDWCETEAAADEVRICREQCNPAYTYRITNTRPDLQRSRL
jgi:hypothetical protein